MKGWLVSLLLLGALWVLLTGGAPESWVVGGPTVLFAAWAGQALSLSQGARIRPVMALAFLAWFLVSSLRGGWDVALRAFRRPAAVSPDRLSYPCRLPPGLPRLLFVHALSLLPGTLFLEDRDGVMELHILNRDMAVEAELGTLEDRIARLFRRFPGEPG